MTATYFMTPGSGVGYTPDGTLPSGAVPCTEAQYASPQSWTVSNGAIVAVSPPVPTAAQILVGEAYALLEGGLELTCTSTPAINATYPCDETTIRKIANIQLYIAAAGKFPSGALNFWLKTGPGAGVTFPSAAIFTEFAEAYASFVAACTDCIDGAPGAALPSATVTIA